mmetsp:Transcript_15297/g.44223  ORF Transcript_15297/g.44223 Transcript_15297/m.44223 type:complete len:100 (+) Transcript_15297:873-1172(+)
MTYRCTTFESVGHVYISSPSSSHVHALFCADPSVTIDIGSDTSRRSDCKNTARETVSILHLGVGAAEMLGGALATGVGWAEGSGEGLYVGCDVGDSVQH